MRHRDREKNVGMWPGQAVLFEHKAITITSQPVYLPIHVNEEKYMYYIHHQSFKTTYISPTHSIVF